MTANSGEESDGGFTYDVLLSFRGEDTRGPFIGHLVKSLREKGIKVFIDEDNLGIGEDISSALLRAIKESKISIIVFSQNYASSKWCLLELEKIIECTENNKKQLAFPIFYHVDPSDIRNQKNSYGDAMIHHENLCGEESQEIKGWRSALSKVGHLTGHHIHTGSEAKHIEEIVEKVCARIAPKPLHVDDDLVGLEHHVEEVKSLLGLKDNNRCMLGIYGRARIGKTELAKVLYNKIAHEFDVACFLANVGVNSKRKGIEYLQKTLISEMSEPLKSKFGSTCKGISEMKKRLKHKKVLLVLDGVDNIEQINELAGKGDWFGLGSRIIVTTRDKSLVGRHQFEKFSYYKMSAFNDQHSLELFSQQAFKISHPKRGYEDVSARVVSYAKGLPLIIKSLASSLSAKTCVEAWEDAMDDIEKIPHDIRDVLDECYDATKHFFETAFVDIGGLSKRERKENKNKRTNWVAMVCEIFGLKNSLDYCENAAKDSKTDWMMQELCLPQHNGTNSVQQDIKYLHHWPRTAGTTERSFDCKFCRRGFTSFQALGDHINSHNRVNGRAKAEAKADAELFINMSNPNNSSSSSTSYNQNTISVWSKYGVDTCKFLLIFDKGEVLDFQRLNNVDVIL